MKRLIHLLRRSLTLLTTVAFLGSSLWLPAQAATIGTESLVHQERASSERERVKSLLSRDDVEQQLQAWGVDPQQARMRVDSLSNAEVAQLAAKMDEMPAGGDVLGVIVFLFVLLLITDILGFTDVFPFTRSVQ